MYEGYWCMGNRKYAESSFIWGSNESSHFTVLHAVLLLVLLESVQLDHEDELVEF